LTKFDLGVILLTGDSATFSKAVDLLKDTNELEPLDLMLAIYFIS